MAITLRSHPPIDMSPIASPSGPFTFTFSLPRKVDVDEAITIPTNQISTMTSLPPSKEDLKIAPIERLPSELHTLIATYLPLPSLIIHLSWTCRRLYSSLGPTNRLLWYKILFRRLTNIPWNLSCPYIPRFAAGEDYYQRCLDIMCNRSGKKACQRCLLVDDGYTFGCTGVAGGKNDEKAWQWVDIFVAGVYGGTWCWDCAKEVYESIAIVNLQTPLPTIPATLHATILSHPCGDPKPGFFVSRAAIAEAIKEQCPNGGYSPFNIHQHAEPDIREAKPYILKTVIGFYRQYYQHLHVLFDAKELGRGIKGCLEIKKFKMTEGSSVRNEIIDAVFGIAKTYLTSKETEDEEKREEERLEACKRFLSMFFGIPNTTQSKDFKVAVPTTRFLAYIAKRYWLTRMEEMGRNVETESGKVTYCVEDKPKKRCGFCVLASEDGDEVKERYSPVLMVCHIISEHPEKLMEEWPEVPDLESVKKVAVEKVEKKVVKKGRKGAISFTERVEGKGFDEEYVEDIRFLFGDNAEVVDGDEKEEGNVGVKGLLIQDGSESESWCELI
ncbi:uncharacterized protein DFL_003081 [Arthrobotrys flagrans]|uniref:F-box domain-containing protein n=1 Tax=Arthrobotrys flagrans TaxID=97331 RepID=A0A437ACV4_ARTFL|nr:hypothetical protein DFL_003081 [Arthrobotrys flagrans]